MADIDRIVPGNPIIPPVPQDHATEERKRRRDGEKRDSTDDEKENNRDNGREGIDYYA